MCLSHNDKGDYYNSLIFINKTKIGKSQLSEQLWQKFHLLRLTVSNIFIGMSEVSIVILNTALNVD